MQSNPLSASPPSQPEQSFAPVPTMRRPIVQATVSAGTAFKIGFFGAIGALVVSSLFWIVLLVFFGSCLTALRPTTP
jgi:hypothetical protein